MRREDSAARQAALADERQIERHARLEQMAGETLFLARSRVQHPPAAVGGNVRFGSEQLVGKRVRLRRQNRHNRISSATTFSPRSLLFYVRKTSAVGNFSPFIVS